MVINGSFIKGDEIIANHVYNHNNDLYKEGTVNKNSLILDYTEQLITEE